MNAHAYQEADAQIDAILLQYKCAVAEAILLGEQPPVSPLPEILAIREKSLSDLLEVA